MSAGRNVGGLARPAVISADLQMGCLSYSCLICLAWLTEWTRLLGGSGRSNPSQLSRRPGEKGNL
jgi:hypothetical protein